MIKTRMSFSILASNKIIILFSIFDLQTFISLLPPIYENKQIFDILFVFHKSKSKYNKYDVEHVNSLLIYIIGVKQVDSKWKYMSDVWSRL
jgi:hypothetical protein